MNAAREKVEREERCRVCHVGPAYKLEAAHLWPRSRGASGFDEPDLIVPLCSTVFGGTCHADFDDHRLDLLPFLTLGEQVATVRAAGGLELARRRLAPLAYLHPRPIECEDCVGAGEPW